MPEKIDPPEGVLQFMKTESVLLSGSFKRGDFARTEVRVRTAEGWRPATPDEVTWVMTKSDRFVESRKAERADQ